MDRVSRLDRVIAVGLVLLLLGLLGLAVADRSGPNRTASPVAAVGPTTAPSSGPNARSRVPAPASHPAAPTSSVAAPAPASTGSAPSSAGPAPPAGPVSAIGDSIMLDIAPYLGSDIPGVRIDGLVSRQFESGIAVVEAERAAGTLGRVLVIELGTNGTVTAADFDAMMQAASGVERVVFVNVDVPRSWEAPDNAVLAAGVARYPGVAVLADWYALSSGHPEWFTPDEVHLQPAGAQALASLITQSAG